MSSPIEQFAFAAAKVNKLGTGTGETSYYPALNALFELVGRAMIPRTLSTIAQVSTTAATGRRMFPDFGFVDDSSLVVVLPVEVKPASGDLNTLAISSQTRKYAERYGKVLVTNLWQFTLVELVGDSNQLRLHDRTVSLADSADSFFSGKLHCDLERVWDNLLDLVRRGTIQRGMLNTAEDVADLLAYHAQQMRRSIVSADREPDVLFRDLQTVLREGLQIELSSEHLVPTVVQTLVYGVFASWLDAADPARFEWMRSSYTVTVPVFAELLHEALKPRLLRECDLTRHLADVQMVLQWTDRDNFAKDFDGDAIQYFYEPFLARFDETLRKDLGVWYTPRQIADYQVARTHHHIVRDLGVADGLASEDVYVLDPAVGTGTYLIACFDHLYRYFHASGEGSQQAAMRARDLTLSRYIGFEVLPAAFIICHLHLSRHMARAGASLHDGDRLRIYLTNSLTGWNKDSAPDSDVLFPELTEELRSAAEVKHTVPVVAVIGNPPYEGYSTAETDEEREMMEPIATATRSKWGVRKHRLNDLYVRFWMVATHRIVDITGRGVVSFITNRAWIGGRSYPAIREHIVAEFDDVWVDDLHGGYHDQSVKGDQSIFTSSIAAGIKVGTSIVTAVRSPDSTCKHATVHVADYRGSAIAKRNALAAVADDSTTANYTQIPVDDSTRYRFVAPDGDDAPPIDDYLDFFRSGVQTIRDELVMDFDKNVLIGRVTDYYDPALTFDEVAERHPGVLVKRSGYDPRKVRQRLTDDPETGFRSGRVVRFLYRPFDYRYMYWELRQGLLNRPRRELAPYFGIANQLTLVVPQTPRKVGACRPLPVRTIASMESVEPNARIFPLYRPDTELLDGSGTETGSLFERAPGRGATMVSKSWEAAAASVLDTDDPITAGEAVFFSLVAVTHSRLWLDCQPVELDDFPSVPLPADRTSFESAATLGRKITCLYDLDVEVPGVTRGTPSEPLQPHLQTLGKFDDVGNVTVPVIGTYGKSGGVRNGDGDVYWSGQNGWHNIGDDVWSYKTATWFTLSKWLSYRVGSGLDKAGRQNFQSICRRIQALLDLESACDEVYEAAVANPLERLSD